MRNLKEKLAYRKLNYSKLSKYGFKKHQDYWMYETYLKNNKFKVEISIKDSEVTTHVKDTKSGEEYILVDLKTTLGEYASEIKATYEDIIADFIAKCTDEDIFKKKQTKAIIKYIKEKYHADLEFLWANLPDAAIWRYAPNQKWYGLLMVITGDKLGLKDSHKYEVLNLRYAKDQVAEVIDYEHIFPAYHMNKRSWLTIKLDGTLELATILKLVDNSYNLVAGK